MSKEKASSTVTHIDPGQPQCPPGRRWVSQQAGGEGSLGPWPWGVGGHIFQSGCAPRFLLRSMASPLRPHLPSSEMGFRPSVSESSPGCRGVNTHGESPGRHGRGPGGKEAHTPRGALSFLPLLSSRAHPSPGFDHRVPVGKALLLPAGLAVQ